MRLIYNVLFYLLLPLLVCRLIWRSLKQPAYRSRIAERFGFHKTKLNKTIWVHAVSVGEALAAIPLIKKLQSQYSQTTIVVTTMTPTGAERVKAALGESVIHRYIPYDFSGAVKRFLKATDPQIAIILETELWPNLLHYCAQKTIPVCLINARLSAKSAAGYKRIAALTKTMLQSISLIAAHGEVDAERFISLGADRDRMFITGNIKFDLPISEELLARGQKLRDELGRERFVWVAASTHEGEEEVVIAAHQQLLQHNPAALLILVPRHPNRFDSIAKLSSQTFKTSRRSLAEPCTSSTQVYLGDTMGELLLLYGASDAAFVGGSLIPRGGHNILEAGAMAKPIITGESLYNFAEISQKFVAADALIKVTNREDLANQLLKLQNKTYAQGYGKRALEVVSSNRGALEKQIQLITNILVA